MTESFAEYFPATLKTCPASLPRLLQTRVKVLLLTNEYPPHNYGGAGVHVEYLSRELARLIDVEVRCFGDQKGKSGRLTIRGFQLDDSRFHCPKPLRSTFGAVQRCGSVANSRQ